MWDWSRHAEHQPHLMSEVGMHHIFARIVFARAAIAGVCLAMKDANCSAEFIA
jgi:hypothetical protein